MTSLASRRDAANWSIWLHRAAIVLGTIVLLGGKITTGRIQQSVEAFPDIDVRIAALIAATLLEAFHIFRTGAVVRWKNEHLLLVFVPLTGFVAYCCLAEVFVWGGAFRSSFFSDLFYLLWLVALFGIMFPNQADLVLLARTAELAAFGLFLVLLSQSVGTVEGLAERWSTSVTTFRIELVGLCTALYLLYVTPQLGWRLLHVAVAVCLIYAALATASRTSILVLPGLLVAFIFYFLVRGRWWVISVVGGAILAGTLLFSISDRADALVQQLTSVLVAELPMASQIQVAEGENGVSIPDPIEEAIRRLNDPQFQAYCRQSLQAVSDLPVSVENYSCSRYVALPDSTHRLRMMMKALTLLGENPLFGVGAEGYHLTLAYGEKEAATYSYPHNLLLEVAARTGLVGTLLMAISALGVGAVLVRALVSSQSVVFLCGIPLIYALASLTGGDIYDARSIWAVAAAIAAACGPIYFSSQRGTAQNDAGLST